MSSRLSIHSSQASSSASSSDTSEDYEDYEDEYRLAQREWEESLQQLQTIFSIVLLPFVGKWLGRKWSHWAYSRYLAFGFTKQFVFGRSASHN